MIPIAELTSRSPWSERIDVIVLRPARQAGPVLPAWTMLTEAGLNEDHAPSRLRAVTLIQAEHLPVISALALTAVTPALLRRNLVVARLNLQALRGVGLRIGTEAGVEVTDPCPFRSGMEEALGEGGYNAVRGHGGWYACAVRPGPIPLGDMVVPRTPAH